MNTKFLTSTSLVHLVRVGMYDSLLSPENIFSYEFEDPENQNRDFDAEWNRFDGAKYKAEVGRRAAQQVETLAAGWLNGKYGIKSVVSNGEILSPREYNFETDELSIDIEMEENFMDTLKANFSKWETGPVAEWLHDHYTSYDGFWSAVPNNASDIAAAIEDGITGDFVAGHVDRLIGVYAECCLVDAGYFKEGTFDDSPYEQACRELIENIECNCYWDEFLAPIEKTA